MLWVTLLLDRLHINLHLSNERYKAYIEQLYLMQSCKDEFLPGVSVKIWKKGDFTTYFRYGAGKHPIADIVLGSSKSGSKYLSVQLFPGNFTGDRFNRFKKDLSVMIPLLTYEYLYFEGRVAYIELAHDCLSLDRDRIIPYRSHARASNLHIEPETGYRGTITIGSNKSREKCRIYAKDRQLKNFSKVDTAYGKFPSRTRFEIISRHIGMSASEVPSKMKNRFKNIECFDLPACRGIIADSEWQAFIDSCRDDGAVFALRQNPHRRKHYLAMLRSCAVPHFTPASGWMGVAEAMAIVAP